MAPADDDVILNVYELIPDQQQAAAASSSASTAAAAASPSPAVSSLFSRILTPLGMGAYHTSLSVPNGYTYTFAAGAGIVRALTSNDFERGQHVPRNGMFKESITLGTCRLERGEINEVINMLRREFFTESSYHMAKRNCNHFSEVFGTALVLYERLADQDPPCLETYPKWINRLARSATAFGIDGGDACDVISEARKACGCNEKVGWNLSSSTKANSSSSQVDSRKGETASGMMKKKELTEKQKAALAKIRKGKS